MPYTFKKTGNQYTAYKKTGDKLKVVGHTKGTEKAKEAYKTALNIGAAKADGAKIPKIKKENMTFDNQVGDMYAVQRPYDGCDANKLVHKVDPLMGINGAGIDASQVYGAYLDEKAAMVMAEKLCKEFTDAAVMLEKKKEVVVGRLKKAIDELEAKRTENVNMIKENPKESGAHKETIAQLATKIDDLMTKLEKIENSKKEIKKDKEDKKKKSLKESKFTAEMGKTKTGDNTVIVKKDGVELSREEQLELSDKEKEEIVKLKRDAVSNAQFKSKALKK